MQFADFEQQIAAEVSPVYWLKGDDYWATEACRKLEALADPMEVSVYTPLDAMQDALWALNSYSMFGGRRVIVLRDFASFAEEDKRALTAYAAQPTETSVLVFYRTVWAPEVAVVCNFDKVRDMTAYLEQYCRREGVTATRDALLLLADYCQQDMSKAMVELGKLRAYSYGAAIDEAAVKAVVSPDQNYQVFHFADRVAAGDYVGAHKVLDTLFNGRDMGAFLGMIINHYRRAFYGRISGLKPAELAPLMDKAKPYTITKAIESTRCYSATALLALLRTLYRIEYECKTFRMDAAEALDLAIAEAIERRNT